MDHHISIAELRKMSEMLFENLELLGIKNIKIDHDYYWHIWPKEKYMSEKKPIDMTLGQLSDDLRDVKDMLNAEYTPTVRNFLDLASILTYIGEKSEVDLISDTDC